MIEATINYECNYEGQLKLQKCFYCVNRMSCQIYLDWLDDEKNMTSPSVYSCKHFGDVRERSVKHDNKGNNQ